MRAATRLQPHHSRRLLRKKLLNLAAPQLALHHHRPSRIHPVNLEHGLRQIQTNHAMSFMDGSLCLVESTSPVWHMMPSGAVHPIIARSEATKQSRSRAADTGLLRFARNDGGTCVPILAARSCPSFAISLPLYRNRGRRECRVRAAPAVSCAESVHFGAHELRVQRKHSDIPCAMALRLTSYSPPVNGLVCHRRRQIARFRRLDASIAAPGPHDFAVRNSASSGAQTPPDAPAPPHPIPTLVTMAQRPSSGMRREIIILIYRNVKRNIFASGA